ncbi:ABC transporter substrate-binding protein [Deltaproteobacteria bacterium TL4]
MHKRRIALFAGLALLIFISLLGYYSSVKKQPTPILSKPIRISRYYWPGQFWKDIAFQKGWFQEAGLQVELVDTNPDYFSSLQDMVEEKMDVNNFTLFDLIRYNAQGADLVMVINTDTSTGADGIASTVSISKIEDLRNKRIGVQPHSYSEYILYIVLQRQGLTPEDVKTVSIAPEKTVPALTRGDVDAIVTWEPLLTQAIQQGKGHKLFDSSAIPGLSPSGEVFHRQFIQERPQDVQTFVRVWQRTTQFIQEHPQEAFGIIADLYKVSIQEVITLVQQDHIVGVDENRIVFKPISGFSSLYGTAEKMTEFMLHDHLMSQPLNIESFLEPHFIQALSASGEVP